MEILTPVSNSLPAEVQLILPCILSLSDIMSKSLERLGRAFCLLVEGIEKNF